MEVFRQMVVKKIAKRIAALGTGAVLVGSSIMGAAAAADLSAYPGQYIKDGKFTGVMVVGDNAKAEDVIGVSDIATSMQAAAVKKVSSGGSSVSVENGWQVGTSTKTLELSENDESLNQEAIADIVTFIDDSELPDLLADNEASNSKGTAPYNQNLYFDDTTTGYVQYIEEDNSGDDVTADFLIFENGKQLARYELEFTSSLESDIDTATTPDSLEDLEDVEITMLGQKYSIVTATHDASNGVTLTLMGGSNRDTMLEGATKTYNIDGKDYEVTLTYVDSDEAQFQVNGETTNKMEDGETDKLADGTTLGISEILYQDYAGGIHSATFFLGAQKMVLTDTDITDTVIGGEVEVDDESIDGLDVTIEGSNTATEASIDTITFNMTAQDTYYVPAGGKLSENADLDEKDLLFTRSWDFEYAGLTKEDSTMISVTSSGDDKYNLEFVDGDGNKVKVPLAYASAAGAVNLGDGDTTAEDDAFVVRENLSITKDDYFVLTDNTDDLGERKSYVLRYNGADEMDADNPIISFKNMGSGETIERTLSAGTTTSGNFTSTGQYTQAQELAQIKLGGGTFRVYNYSNADTDDFNILVDMDGEGTIGVADASGVVNGVTNTVTIENKDGAQIAISDAGNTIDFNVTTVSNDDTESLDNPTVISYTISAASSEVDLTEATLLSLLAPENDDDNKYGYTSYGAFVKQNNPTGTEPDELEITYPADQVVPQVFITGSGASFSEVAASEGDSVQVQKIQVGATKLASEVTDIKAVSSILVGGPCANAAAATVMGNPSDCAAGFEPGVGMVKMFDVGNGNVAMLVAGYSALDTRNAAQVVANYKQYAGSLKGTAVEVKKVNNQLTVAQPTPKVVVEEEVAEEPAAE